jgi:SagB-type dehydrogenase family enzyme
VTAVDPERAGRREDEIELRHGFQTLLEARHGTGLLSELYHENSKQVPCDLPFYRRIEYFNSSELGLQLVRRAAKRYACADRVALPEASAGPHAALTDAIARRSSVRRFGGEPLTLDQLATLLRYANGVVEHTPGDGMPRRAIPSGGALYPTELYLLPLECDGLEPGAYHYDPFAHELARFADSPAEPLLGRACYLGAALPTASVALVITACFERQSVKYDERAYRFTLIECGHLAQNLLLMAAASGLGALPVGGFMDDEVNDYLGLDGRREAALYLLLVGSLPDG